MLQLYILYETRRLQVKKFIKKFIIINIFALLFILLIQPTNTYAATVKNVVTRNDGTWLFF